MWRNESNGISKVKIHNFKILRIMSEIWLKVVLSKKSNLLYETTYWQKLRVHLVNLFYTGAVDKFKPMRPYVNLKYCENIWKYCVLFFMSMVTQTTHLKFLT